MSIFDLIFNVVYLLVGCGALGLTGNWLNKHHKASRTAAGLDLAQKLANWSVARVANDSNLAMGQRRTAVVRELQAVLTKHGYNFDIKRLTGLAEMTYQIYKSNGHNIVKPQPTPAPTVDNTPDSPEHPGVSTKSVVNKPSVSTTNEALSEDEVKILNDYRAHKAANK